VSFDGFRPESHGKFRGSQSSFAVTVATTRKFAEAGLLQGLLSTPNTLSEVDEFVALCEFAVDTGAKYVLMNPLSSFGRGVQSRDRLAANDQKMQAIRAATERFRERGLDLVHIRFPNEDKPLSGCDIGRLIYVFADGQLAVCPYVVFAARTPQSRHRDTEFLVGNILQGDVAFALDAYDFRSRYQMGSNRRCGTCAMKGECGKGCPAAVIARGGYIGEIDAEQCPVEDDPRLAQIGRPAPAPPCL
jgi:radical SAM protein with 4Fe4S-binding SPASM domain